jgi:hypothetical protein
MPGWQESGQHLQLGPFTGLLGVQGFSLSDRSKQEPRERG